MSVKYNIFSPWNIISTKFLIHNIMFSIILVKPIRDGLWVRDSNSSLIKNNDNHAFNQTKYKVRELQNTM